MIPIKLRLHNFMSYGADVPPLDFRGIHLACLAGDNGHGKSALLDAITWSLWGRARARSDNELIRQGESAMEVEFEFELDRNVYRVLRKRESRGRGQSVLELQIQAGDIFRPLTENSVRATQARIDTLLRMDYDTFVNSAYIQQGKADAFTTMAPADRKALLSQILGLEAYETFEDRAKQRVKETERALAVAETRLAEVAAELARLPDYELAERRAQNDVVDLATRVRTAENAQQASQRQQQELQAAQRELDDLQRRLGHVEADIADTERELATRRARQTADQALLAEQAAIEAGYAAWQDTRAAEAAWQEKAVRHAQLAVRLSQLEAQVTAARNELLAEQRMQQTQLAEAQARADRAAGLYEKLQQAQAQLAQIAAAEAARTAAQDALRQAAEQRAELQQVNRQLKTTMDELKARLDDLAAATANCPLCRQPLSEHDHARLLADFQQEGRTMGDQFRTNQTELARLDERTRQLEREIAGFDQALRPRATWQRQEAQAEQGLHDAELAAATLLTLQAELAARQTRLDQHDYAAEQQAALASALAEQQGLGYDATAHAALRQRLAELGAWEDRQRDLRRALEERVPMQQQIDALEERLARWQQTVAQDRERAAALRAAVAELPALRTALAAQTAEVRTLESRLERAQLELGAARQRIDTSRQLAAQQDSLAAQRQQLADERTLYEELRVAFGKKGVPAMIIEAAIPEIEEETNHLLGRMTSQRMSVSLETQRETRKGDAIETLDINIKDELGIRAYELLSGGEAFRTNFAIRIALSKLLARRAGARLQTLIIDEGFGTQDATGRDRLVEAITAIQQDFERILVVTHIEELKDQFPVRINVTKGPAGSTYAFA